MFSAAKDMIVSQAASVFINRKIARYGTIEKLKIDSRRQTMRIVGRLLGADEKITVNVEKYEVVRDGAKNSLRILECRSELPWLQNVIEDFVCGRSFDLPGVSFL